MRIYRAFAASIIGALALSTAALPFAVSAQSYAATYGPYTSMCPSPYANYNPCPSGVGGLFGAGGWFSGLFTPNYGYGSQPSYYQPRQQYYYQQSYPTYSYQYQPSYSYGYNYNYGYAPQYSYGYIPQYAPQYSYGYMPQYQYASAGNVYYGY